MSDLPDRWEAATVGEIATVQLGRQRSPKNHTGPHMRPYLRSANVTWNGIDVADVKEMNFDPDEAAVFELRDGDILLNEASGSPGEVGKPAIWRNEIPGACFQNTLLRVRSAEMDEGYLYWYFYFAAFTGRFGEAGRGVNIRHLGKRGLAGFPAPVPPLREQRRIVIAVEEHFSRLDAAEAALNDARRRTEVFVASHVNAAFGELDQRVPLGDLAGVSGGIQKQPKRRPVENKFPFLRVANVKRNQLDLEDVHEIELFGDEIDRYRLKAGDLLVVEGNGSPEQIGRSAIWDEEIANCVHQNHLIRVRPGPGLDPRFLNVFWNSSTNAQQLASVASSTSGLYTLSTSKLKRVVVPVTDMAEQQRIANDLDDVFDMADRIRSELANAQRRSIALRRSVLAAAFTGRLVPQDPSDEPASVLLERIAAERAAAKPSRKKKDAS